MGVNSDWKCVSKENDLRICRFLAVCKLFLIININILLLILTYFCYLPRDLVWYLYSITSFQLLWHVIVVCRRRGSPDGVLLPQLPFL